MSGCRDRFECGILLDGTATRCTGATEICLCGERRCAETDPDRCPESGYAYVFPENGERCVPEASLNEPVISGSVAGEAALCPDQASIPPRCGLLVSGQVATCPGNQTCLCDVNLCANFERTEDCPTGWRRAVDGTCLDLSTINPNLRPGDNGLCPGALTPAPRVSCGRPNEVGLVEDCPEDQTCICSTNRCAIADATACPDTRFRYAPDAADDPAECVSVDDASGERVTAGACADFRPSPIACGSAAAPGGPDCPEADQSCICSAGLCAEISPVEACPTGLRFVGSGDCVNPADQPTAIDDGLCAPDCGVLGGDGRIVQCPFGACICSADAGRCSLADPTCPTGLAFVENNQCVMYSAETINQTLASGALCPANPVDAPCGVSAADGRLARCGPDETCVCDGSVGRCARLEPTCPAGRAFMPTNRCAPADGGAITTVNGVLCPGATPSPPVTCGTLDASGRVQGCQAGEQCICRPDGGACAVAEPACPFGLANAHDGTCVTLSETAFTRPVAADALCPPRAPTPIACGQSAQTECAGVLQCGCRADGTGVCVVEQASCVSGLAEAETLRCVPLSENLQPIETGICPPGGP